MGGTIDLSGNGVNSIGWVAEVNTFADLPAVADNIGKTYMVKTSTGLMITFNLKRAGFYYSDGVTWEKKGEVQQMFRDDELTFQDDLDNTKQIGFQLSSIGTGLRRIFTWPDKNGIIAMLSDIPASNSKFKRSFDTYNMPVPSSYTWNSQTIGAASATTLNNRYRFYACSGMNNGHEGAYANVILPSSYIAGSNIVVTLSTTSNTDAKNYVYYVGITQPKANGEYGGSTETEWIKKTIASALSWPQPKTLYTFDGTNMSPGDELAVMIYRDPNDVADDMTNIDAYIGGFLIEEV